MENGFDAGRKVSFDGLLESLLSVIDKEIDAYRELRSLIAEEYEAVIKPGVEALAGINSRKEGDVLLAAALEESRTKLVKEIAELLGRPEREINFTILAAYADAKHKQELESRKEILLPLIREVNEANEKNKSLLVFSLSHVKSSISFIDNLLSVEGNYESNGRMKSGGLHGMVVNRKG